ncbi:hypothetical protein ABIA30_002894 [Mycobacterium sp. MAA66]|uniref:hypothetical protein n=1 Tax=Mycobacterium sp. MAA66 TaxID=3156297 RepID=UPI003515EF5A
MSGLRGRHPLRQLLTGAVAMGLVLAPTPASIQTAHADGGCTNGVAPWNPYVGNCALGPRPPKIRGSAPDASAIIACRHKPGCLATYVNGP